MYVYVIASWGIHIILLKYLNPGYNKIQTYLSCVWEIKACTAFIRIFLHKDFKKSFEECQTQSSSDDDVPPTLTDTKHTWMQNNKEDISIFRVNPQKPVFISQEMMVHFDDFVILLVGRSPHNMWEKIYICNLIWYVFLGHLNHPKILVCRKLDQVTRCTKQIIKIYLPKSPVQKR